MKKALSLLLLTLLLATGCEQKKENHVGQAHDFETLMGALLPAWKHVQTPEDFANLAFFKEVYEKNIALLDAQSQEQKIPKVIHFIWIGPKAFPLTSIENVRTWIAHHPDWTLKFWTDRERPLPHPKMELCKIQDFPFALLEEAYRNSDNYGEKSDVLRYEILYREGGVYVDHDVKCLKSFDVFNQTYDLYCGLEVPYPTALSSSVLPTNNLVGAKPHHPLLKNVMVWLGENWERIDRQYPGKDREAVINRVSHRTFLALGKMFLEHGNKESRIDIALPSYYFNSPKEELALYAQHQYSGTWFENESDFERKVRKRLMRVSKKVNKLLLAIGLLGALNLIGFGFLGVMLYKARRIGQG